MNLKAFAYNKLKSHISKYWLSLVDISQRVKYQRVSYDILTSERRE